MNESLLRWCDRVGNRRPWPDDRRHTVFQRWAEERSKLLKFSGRLKQPKEVSTKRASKTPWVTFDLNSYSIDPNFLGYPLVLQADDEWVEIFCNNDLIGRHERSYDRGRFIESKEHKDQLLEHRHYGRGVLFRENLVAEFPGVEAMLMRMFESGLDLPSVSRKLYKLIHSYGRKAFREAIESANKNNTSTFEGFQVILHKQEHARGEKPTVAVTLPDNPKVRELSVTSHSLDTYDNL